MSKTVTLRLDDETYGHFRRLADEDNRPLSNFIETAVKRYVEEQQFVDEFEMAEIESNTALNQGLRKGHQDAKRRRGRFAG